MPCPVIPPRLRRRPRIEARRSGGLRKPPARNGTGRHEFFHSKRRVRDSFGLLDVFPIGRGFYDSSLDSSLACDPVVGHGPLWLFTVVWRWFQHIFSTPSFAAKRPPASLPRGAHRPHPFAQATGQSLPG